MTGDLEEDVQQIKTVWGNLNSAKRLGLVLATLGVFFGVLALPRMAAAPNLQLLYAGLEPAAAGEVVRALEQQGAAYEVRRDSIYVDAAARDSLRMTLAAEGLPTNGGRGYELLDSLNGFGTTSQMFDAAYWRAKEGELARTIVASPHISMARVHISNASSNPFQRGTDPTASVTVTPASAPITSAQANALRYLVASAVAGLTPDNVSVLDSDGAILGAQETPASNNAELDRADVLRDRVRRLIEARVGPGNAVVEVSVSTVSQSELIRETRFDPESRVAISSDIEERSDNSQGQNGAVTVASNLPDGDAAESPASTSQASETRERINYEVSQTELEIQRVPGDIKRISVAVLVNKLVTSGADGSLTYSDRPDNELEDLRALVAAAVGYDESRGDEITLRAMEIQPVEASGTPAALSFFDRFPIDVMSLVQMAVLAAVVLGLAVFVLKPLLLSPPPVPTLAAPAPDPRDDAEFQPALTGEIANVGDRFETQDAGSSATEVAQLDPSSASVERLRNLIGDRQEETVEILRSWMQEKGENA